MASPLPDEDYYETLGVSKTADVTTIRKAHRKLALLHHPDRIRDEEAKEGGKKEFQKIQRAYEILEDPVRRARYDAQVKLIELRKERMMRQTSHAPSSTPAHGGYRNRSNEEVYEYVGRVPKPQSQPAYFDRDHYDDHIPDTAPRKADSYDKKPTPPKSERREKVPSRSNEPVDGVSSRIFGQMKNKAAEARARAKANRKMDEAVQRERADKQSSRYAQADQGSDSEYETISPNHFSKGRSDPRYRDVDPGPEPVRSRAQPSTRRPPTYDDEDSQDEVTKWERHHKTGRDYIAEAQQQRPGMTRSGSDAHVYWGGDGRGGRKSGDDNERHTGGTRSRRSAATAEEGRPRPSMPIHTSAPTNLRASMAQEHARSKTSTYPSERDSRRDPPSFNRSQTLPTRSKKESNTQSRGSGLKRETHADSGYYSSSQPNTPEMRGDSPPRESRESRESTRRSSRRAPTSVRYQIVDPSNSDEERGPRINRENSRILNQDEDRHRMFHSPDRSGGGRDNEYHSDREKQAQRPRMRKLDTDTGRSRSNREPPTMSRHDSGRYEAQSPREPHSASRKLFGEVPPPPPSSYSRPSPANVRTSSHGRPKYADQYGESVEFADHKFRQSPNFPTLSRRSSTANAY